MRGFVRCFQQQVRAASKGEVKISLSFHPQMQRINVRIYETRNVVPAADVTGGKQKHRTLNTDGTPPSKCLLRTLVLLVVCEA